VDVFIEALSAYDRVQVVFNYLKSKRNCVTGNVIVPNHVHVLIGLENTQDCFSDKRNIAAIGYI
jgi:REP element-mobilizing transposase RayT